MNPTHGTVTKIVISVLQQLFDKKTIIVSTENQEQITLHKVITINNINVYESSQSFVNDQYIYWETNLILEYGFNAFIGLNADDIDYNHVNDMIVDYCGAAPGEQMFSVYMYGRKAAVTIFITN